MVVKFIKEILMWYLWFGKKVLPLIKYGGVIFLGLVVVLSFAQNLPIPGNFQSLVVMSGSMEPKIHVGSVAIVKPSEDIKTGDIITFSDPRDPTSLVTHRIESIENEIIKTKGDANNTPDNWEVSKNDIVGKFLFSIPFLGYAVNFAKQPQGFLLFILLPALLIIVNEIGSIKKEFGKKYEKKGENKTTVAAMAIGVAFLTFAFSSGKTLALFSDTETSSGNTITVGVWDTVSPGDVVINEVYYDVKDDGTKGTENKNEWIELYNNTDSDISLKKWSLVDSAGTVKTINAEVSIPAKGFAVLSHDNTTWTTYWTLPPEAVTIQLTGAKAWLNNDGGDTLTLRNPSDTEIDFVAWEGGESGWSISADEGKSIARITKGFDTDVVGDWEVLDPPNPGTNPHPPAPIPPEEMTSEPESEPEIEPEVEPESEPEPEPEPASEPETEDVAAAVSAALEDPPESSPSAKPVPDPEPVPESSESAQPKEDDE